MSANKKMCVQRCNLVKLKSLLNSCLYVVINKKTAFAILLVVVFGCVIYNNQINAKLHKKVALLQRKSILDEINKLSVENIELEKLLHNIRWNLPNLTHTHTQSEFPPSIEYENLRRKGLNTVKEFWYFIKNKVKEISQNQTETKHLCNRILSIGIQHKQHLRNSLSNLSMVDGYSTWRSEESKNLTNLIQARLHYIQNPRDCKTTKKILCPLKKFACGFGCSFHQVISCLIIAYDLKRTLVLDTNSWVYSSAGWKSFFVSVSNSCVSWTNNTVVDWPANNSAEVIRLPFIPTLKPNPTYLPMAVPSDIQFRLERLHGNPSAWWIGQMATYLFKLNNITTSFIEDYKKKIGFKKPVVGVHIRRTDKLIREAKFHNVSEYMEEVDEYYNEVIGNKTEKRRIYLATEEQRVINEAKKNYSHYEILTNDINFIKGRRFSTDSLKGVLIDLYFLSNADFLVCTFSSNVCRLAYELMQLKFPDASDRFRSLDAYFVYGGKHEPITHIATGNYKPTNSKDLELNIEDKISKYYDYWNGYSNGMNLRTKKKGLFPSFKAKVFCRSYNFSNYPEVS